MCSGKRAMFKICRGLALLAILASRASAQRPGDVNCDGIVNGDDTSALVANVFGEAPGLCLIQDINGDGAVSSADLVASVKLVTAPPPQGPTITYLGFAGAGGVPVNPIGTTSGIPIYFRGAGSGFKIVVEGRAGLNGVMPGQIVMNSDPLNPTRRPDVWVESSSTLGDGSPAVCDGGVPAVNPPDFGATQRVANALNDLACNFVISTGPNFACTQDRFGAPAFIGTGTQVQYCLQVSRMLEFPSNDTLLTVLLRDTVGTIGPLRQMILRVGSGPVPATFTVSPTATRFVPSPTRPPTVTATPTRTPTSTSRPSQTRSPTRTATLSPQPTGTPTAVPTLTFSTTITASPTATATQTRLSVTETPSSTATRGTPPSSTATPSTTPTASSTATLLASATSTMTATRSSTRTRTSTPTRTTTATRTSSATPTTAPGPIITFIGLTRSDDTLIQPSGTTADGIPLYVRPSGFGFSLVVEAKRGPDRLDVGRDSFVPDLTALPDLQVEVSQALGNGSSEVCDRSGPMAGGVPATDPVSFDPTETNINTINDLSCRFVDGTGNPTARGLNDACTTFATCPSAGAYCFVKADSNVQFCAPIGLALQFPPGDTVVTVRLLDTVLDQFGNDTGPPGSGTAGGPARIVVRVGDVNPTVTPTMSATPTGTATRTLTPPIGSVSPSPTRSPTLKPTPTALGPSATPTRTRTRTPTFTPTRSPTLSPSPIDYTGPIVTFFGVTTFDGTLTQPVDATPDGAPIYARPIGAGFMIVIEGRPGSSGRAVASSSYQSGALPDLQIVASRSLGNGSPEVCDYRGPTAGGVPAVDPPSFDLPDNIAAINDLACRFRDGADTPAGRTQSEACVLFDSGNYGFVDNDLITGSTLQFCGAIGRSLDFPDGDTTLTARLRDTGGHVGQPAQMVLRVGL